MNIRNGVENAIAQPVNADYRLPMHRRRKVINVIALTLSLAAMAFGLVWLIWILWDTLWLGVRGLSAAMGGPFFSSTGPGPLPEGCEGATSSATKSAGV